MTLNFNFDGKTLLKDWWQLIRDNLRLVEASHNQLAGEVDSEKERLDGEITARADADSALSGRVDSEASARQAADGSLEQKINSEATARQAADGSLEQKINSEAMARQAADSSLELEINSEASTRQNADNAIKNRVTAVEGKAHTHDNISVLGGITADDVEKWNGIRAQVSKGELDEAMELEAEARQNGDNGIICALGEYIAYADEQIRALVGEAKRLYTAMGIVVFDGGLFGAEPEESALDGGAFTDTESELLDCGGFGAVIAAVMDGGTY